MEFRAIKASSPTKELYAQAFPKEERLPWWVLRLSTLVPDVALTAYYDGANFCGFTHTTSTDKVLFLMFFAVQSDLRGKGYGSAILDYLKRQNPGKAIVLNVEPLDPTVSNAQERVNRMLFYRKNGFYDTGYDITEVGGIFRVLSTVPKLDTNAYRKVFRKISLGLWRPKITEVTKCD